MGQSEPLAMLWPGESADSENTHGSSPPWRAAWPGRGREGPAQTDGRMDGRPRTRPGQAADLSSPLPSPDAAARAGRACWACRPGATSAPARALRGGWTGMSLRLGLLAQKRGSPTVPAGGGRVPVPVPARWHRPPHSPSNSSFSSARSRFFCSSRILLISWSMRAAAFSSSVRHQGQQRQVSEWAMVGASAGTRRHGPGRGEGSWQRPAGGRALRGRDHPQGPLTSQPRAPGTPLGEASVPGTGGWGQEEEPKKVRRLKAPRPSPGLPAWPCQTG